MKIVTQRSRDYKFYDCIARDIDGFIYLFKVNDKRKLKTRIGFRLPKGFEENFKNFLSTKLYDTDLYRDYLLSLGFKEDSHVLSYKQLEYLKYIQENSFHVVSKVEYRRFNEHEIIVKNKIK